MKILRYTPELQKATGSKVAAEPWLHIGINGDKYAIWVWDTRKIVGGGKLKPGVVLNGQRAKDNHEPLVGTGAKSFVFDYSKREEELRQDVEDWLDEHVNRADAYDMGSPRDNYNRYRHDMSAIKKGDMQEQVMDMLVNDMHVSSKIDMMLVRKIAMTWAKDAYALQYSDFKDDAW